VGNAADEAGLKGIAEQAALWLDAPCRIRPISVSENRNFELAAADGARYVLRIHRPGYRRRVAIASELDWLVALYTDTTLCVPRPVPGRDGKLLQSVAFAGQPHDAVLFHFEPGHEPDSEGDLTPLFHALGSMAARLHRHVEEWSRPSGFDRPALDDTALLDPSGAWGDWRKGPGLDAAGSAVLEHAEKTLRVALARYGRDPERFGLIHADMRLGNLLVAGDRICLIDFDDSGIGWFGYDFAAAASFHEHRPERVQWEEAWLAGYRLVRPFSVHDEAMLEAMVLLRRLALLAWIGSHAETDLARRHAPGFAAGTVELAESWLMTSVVR
jgi:Ser/Thr protein kinase RdoA (MazF antagonist)